MQRDVYVAGAAMTSFGKFVDRPLASLTEEAVSAAMADCGATADAVDAIFFANAAAGLLTGQEMIRGQTALRDLPELLGKPIVNVENACASGSTAFNLACMAINAGSADVVLAIGAEKLSHHDRARSFAAFEAGVDVEHPPFANTGEKSMFMDIYAQMTRDYMKASGATVEDFARVAVKSHDNAALNPKAQFRRPVTLDEVLDSRLVSDPLRLLMCSPIGDGAAALVVASEAGMVRLGVTPGVRVLASVVLSGTGAPDQISPVTLASRRAYEQAGIGPSDVDVVELHDAAAPAELMAFEELGLCEPGQARELLASGHTAIGGRCCVNPSGGLLSKGHPVGATGAAQLVELTEQLRGVAGERQSGTPRVALAENAGGWIGGGPAAASITLLGV